VIAVLEVILWHVWWVFPPRPDEFDLAYHGMNLLEGSAWTLFAGLVLTRWMKHRRSIVELVYALLFVTLELVISSSLLR
jgi:hypothetical protein